MWPAAKIMWFLILTVTRTGDVLGATSSKIDLDAWVWRIAGKSMDARKEHRVSLKPNALWPSICSNCHREACFGLEAIQLNAKLKLKIAEKERRRNDRLLGPNDH